MGIYVGFLVCDVFCIPSTFFIARNNFIAIVKMFRENSAKPFKTEFKDTI